MNISSLDYISPKITLKYNGRNSHISRIGGFLSLCLSIIFCILIFYCFWNLLEPKFYSSFLYEESTNDNKLYQYINYSGINHFLQLYSHSNNGWFGEMDDKNMIIYAVKENNNLYRNKYLNLELSNIEHWLYDKCDKINNIDANLFDEISKYINNYTSSICIRFYFNPNDKKYYEIGNDGYVEPYLETSKLNEKKYPFKIIVEKCNNKSYINKNMGHTCNSEIEINKYFDIYDEIFIYYLYNLVIPISITNQFKKNIYCISSKLGQLTYFMNDIIFQPIKIMKTGSFGNTYKDIFSFRLYNYFEYQKQYDNENNNLVGIFNLYLNNNIITYQIRFSTLLDILSHLGGLIKIFFLFFKILNYFNHRYIMIENVQDLFKINTGIESSFNGAKYRAFDNTAKNSKINLKNSNIKEENSRKFLKEFSPVNNKRKFKFFEGASPKEKQSSKKNMPLYQINISSNKRNNISKKNTNTFDVKNRDKRKSYLSQGYRVKSKDNKDNSIYIKNQSYNDNNISNNEFVSSKGKNKNYNNENISIIFNRSKKSNNEYNPLKNIITEYNPLKSRKSKRNLNLKLPSNKIIHEKIDNTHLGLKSHNERHKSINYSNQKKLFRNSIFSKNQLTIKNSSDLINDSSKQMLVKSNNLLLTFNQNDQSNFAENNYRGGIINDNTEYANSTKNFQTITLNNANSSIDINYFLKSLIKSKLKMEISEGKEGFTNPINHKIKFSEILKSIFICSKKSKRKVNLINNFRNKLLSEEHLYKSYINLYVIQKIFQIEEAYKFDFKELYNNL